MIRNRVIPSLLSTLVVTSMLFIGASMAWATVARLMSLEALVERSDVIVHGVVESQQSHWSDEYNLVVTRTTFDVKEALTGEVLSSKGFVIEQFGGTASGKTTMIAGDAHFHLGEEVVLFANEDRRDPGSGVYYLTSMAQSKYKIQRTRGSDETQVWRDLSDISFAPESGALQPMSEAPSSERSFFAHLRALIAGIKGGAQ